MVTNNIEEYKGVYVFAQQVDNEISGIALELLGKDGTSTAISGRSRIGYDFSFSTEYIQR